LVLVQFAISPELRPPVAKEALVTEPGADRGPHAGSPRGVVVATGSKHSTVSDRSFCREIVDCRLSVGSGRYHSRFCNDSPTLRNGINSMKLHLVPGRCHPSLFLGDSPAILAVYEGLPKRSW